MTLVVISLHTRFIVCIIIQGVYQIFQTLNLTMEFLF